MLVATAGCGRASLHESQGTSGETRPTAQGERLRDHPLLLAAYLDARQREGGADYAVVAAGNDWRAANAKHTFSTVFGPSGVRIAGDDQATRIRMRLIGMGRGTAKPAPPVTKREARGQRVTYRRGTLSEWYVNGPLGLEQSFEFARRPAGASGEVILALAVSGNATPQLSWDGDRVLLQTTAGARYAYRDLVVYDAAGRRLPARMTVVDQRIALRFDDRGARYPVVVDPFVAIEEQKLVASDAAFGDLFGDAVSVSGDTAVVGATYNEAGGEASGAAYVFVRSGNTWTEQQKLTASDAAANSHFGISVAVSADTVVVGAFRGDGGVNDSGTVYVFVRSDSTWTEQQKLTASDAGVGDAFGWSVSLSGDTVVVGAFGDDDGALDSGAAYVFVRSGNTWTEQQKLTASDAAAEDQFSRSVALSGDTAVVGASNDDDAGNASGAAYVFVRSGNTWTEQQKLTASDAAAADFFGSSVALWGDTAIIGAPNDDSGGLISGSTYVFVRGGSAWTQQQKLIPSGDTARGFGNAVALSGDTAVIGAPYDQGGGVDSGAAYVFVRSGSTWTQQRKLTASDGAASDQVGVAVALSGDTAVIGGWHLYEGVDSGAAYVFRLGHDEDSDGLPNTADNCPFAANASQTDTDGDGIGDACDGTDNLDVDGDGVANTDDNCPFTVNADQVDGDSDGFGDACDTLDNSDSGGCAVSGEGSNAPWSWLLLGCAIVLAWRRRSNITGKPKLLRMVATPGTKGWTGSRP